MSEDIYEKHSSLSDKIRANYAKRDEDPKFLELAIKACEEQIAMAKQVAENELKGEKHFVLKTDGEILADFKKDMAEDLKTIEGTKEQKDLLDKIDKAEAQSSGSLKKPNNSPPPVKYGGTTFDPNIHKSPDDFVIVPGKLYQHTGYNQLCIIREKQGKWSEVLQLAEQAKTEGWIGDWEEIFWTILRTCAAWNPWPH